MSSESEGSLGIELRATLISVRRAQHQPVAFRLSGEDQRRLEALAAPELAADRSAFDGVPLLATDQQRSFLSATHPYSGEVSRFFLHLAGRRTPT